MCSDNSMYLYLSRAPPGSTNPPLAINLTNTGPGKIISQSSRSGPLSLDSNPAGVTTSAQIITSSASTQGTGKGPTPAANLPIQPARFMALPVASSQGGSAAGKVTIKLHNQLLKESREASRQICSVAETYEGTSFEIETEHIDARRITNICALPLLDRIIHFSALNSVHDRKLCKKGQWY